MSRMPFKLDLSGIDLKDIGSSRTKRNITVEPPRKKSLDVLVQPPKKTPAPIKQTPVQPSISIRRNTARRSPNRQIIICILFIFTCAIVINIPFSGQPPHIHHIRKGHLRKMIRMKCKTRETTTHCTTAESAGDYVVSLNNCKDIYEFNGIPFTDILKDSNGNYRVPSSTDSTLKIKDGCENIAATVDTDVESNEYYATSFSNSLGAIERIVWITGKCYQDFTVTVNGEAIYEFTPTSMIEHIKLDSKIAYVYESDVEDLKGSINIQGTGCDSPIMIYTQRK